MSNCATTGYPSNIAGDGVDINLGTPQSDGPYNGSVCAADVTLRFRTYDGSGNLTGDIQSDGERIGTSVLWTTYNAITEEETGDQFTVLPASPYGIDGFGLPSTAVWPNFPLLPNLQPLSLTWMEGSFVDGDSHQLTYALVAVDAEDHVALRIEATYLFRGSQDDTPCQ